MIEKIKEEYANVLKRKLIEAIKSSMSEILEPLKREMVDIDSTHEKAQEIINFLNAEKTITIDVLRDLANSHRPRPKS